MIIEIGELIFTKFQKRLPEAPDCKIIVLIKYARGLYFVLETRVTQNNDDLLFLLPLFLQGCPFLQDGCRQDEAACHHTKILVPPGACDYRVMKLDRTIAAFIQYRPDIL